MAFLRDFAEILEIVKNQVFAKSAKSISAPSGPIWLKFLLGVLELIVRHSINQLFCLKSIFLCKKGVSTFCGKTQKERGVQWNFTLFAKVCYEVALIQKLF